MNSLDIRILLTSCPQGQITKLWFEYLEKLAVIYMGQLEDLIMCVSVYVFHKGQLPSHPQGTPLLLSATKYHILKVLLKLEQAPESPEGLLKSRLLCSTHSFLIH